MAIRKILQLGDPALREVAKPVNDPTAPEIRALVEDLADTLAHWRKTTGYGRGIAGHFPAAAGRGTVAHRESDDHGA
jgi:peptide deformylase